MNSDCPAVKHLQRVAVWVLLPAAMAVFLTERDGDGNPDRGRKEMSLRDKPSVSTPGTNQAESRGPFKSPPSTLGAMDGGSVSKGAIKDGEVMEKCLMCVRNWEKSHAEPLKNHEPQSGLAQVCLPPPDSGLSAELQAIFIKTGTLGIYPKDYLESAGLLPGKHRVLTYYANLMDPSKDSVTVTYLDSHEDLALDPVTGIARIRAGETRVLAGKSYQNEGTAQVRFGHLFTVVEQP